MSKSDEPENPRVKITLDLHRRIAAATERLAQVGWTGVGARRSDPITRSSVLDQAVALLEERLSTRR